jgi:hypothetical protein
MATLADKRPFHWGFWALAGSAGWIVLMIALGAPTAILAVPALGPICGWVVGGVLHLARSLLPH